MEEKKATEVTGCKQCQKGLKTQKGFCFNFYILTSIYGTLNYSNFY
jgi:hypothetical protein